jgi:16S rRNA (cytosine967-C5)-methyltransferase
VPAHAVVNEAVESIRQLGQARASGFVNAVLRSLARAPGSRLPPRPASGADRAKALAYLSVTLSHPAWLVERWLVRHGFEAAEAWCRFNNEVSEVSVRPAVGVTADDLSARLQAAGVTAERGKFARDALRLPSGWLGRLEPALRADLVVQEEASQVVAHAVGARPGERVLDLCAAPGGKTLVLAHDMQNAGTLVASDLRPGRLTLLRATLARGQARASVAAIDATGRLPFGPVFDRILVDAPCSGLGTLRRDPDLKWSRRPEHLAGLAAVERRILACAADAVRPGGLLVYATCSSEAEENEQVVDAFLAGRADYGAVPAEPGPAVIEPGRLIDSRGFLRTLPFRDGMDAFFAATLRRRAAGL